MANTNRNFNNVPYNFLGEPSQGVTTYPLNLDTQQITSQPMQGYAPGMPNLNPGYMQGNNMGSNLSLGNYTGIQMPQFKIPYSALGLGDSILENGFADDMTEYNGLSTLDTTNLLGMGDLVKNPPTSMWGKFSDFTSKNGPLLNIGAAAITGIGDYVSSSKLLKENKRQFNLNRQDAERNYQDSRKMTNMSLEDRQRARVNGNSNYMGVEEYMKKYGI